MGRLLTLTLGFIALLFLLPILWGAAVLEPTPVGEVIAATGTWTVLKWLGVISVAGWLLGKGSK